MGKRQRLLTDEQIDWLKSNSWQKRPQMIADEMNAKFGLNLTKAQIMNQMTTYHVVNGLYGKQLPGERSKCSMFSLEQEAYLKSVNHGKTTRDMQRVIMEYTGKNLTLDQVKGWRARNHLDSGMTGWFQRNNPPVNKSKKLEEVVGKERAEKIKKAIKPTLFKKGNIPHNHVEVGTKIKDSNGYWKLKVAEPNKWKWIHRMVWEEVHGPLKAGEAVIFLDGNPDHIELSNLMALTYEDLMRVNSPTSFGGFTEDPELNRTIAQTAKLLSLSSEKKKDG